MEKKVSFYSEGYKLIGTLFVPEELPKGQKRSAIIFCSGFTGTRDTSMLAISRYLCQQGYIGLSLDYRGFGESEGPKWRLIPLEQVEDVRNAITFLQQQPQVEGSSIGLFGTSFGGAIAVYTAALDERARCVVVNASVGNGQKWLRSLRNNWDWKAFLEELEEDRARRVLTGTSKMVNWLHIMVPDPASREFSERRLKDPNACRELPLETGQAVIEFKPDEVVHRIAPRPILFIAAERDVLTPPELLKEVYDRAGEPKRFKVIQGAAHYDTYFTPPYPQLVMDETLAWFKQYMPPMSSQSTLV